MVIPAEIGKNGFLDLKMAKLVVVFSKCQVIVRI